MLRAPRKKRTSKLGPILFGLIFTLIGAAVFAGMVAVPLYRAWDARDWAAAECTIEHSEVVERTDSDGDTTYGVEVRYRYVVDGRTYRAARHDFTDGTRTSSAARPRAIVARLPPGRTVPCWYDPADPTQATIERTGWIGLIGLVPLAFVLIGVAVIAQALRRRGAVRRDELPGGGARIRRRGADGFEVAFIGAFALAFGPTGVWIAMSGAGLFAIPFVLVGAGMTGWFAYKLCAYLTRVTVTVDHAEARPGDAIDVRWEVAAPLAAREIAATLVGRERVVYEDGEDTRTEDHELHREDLRPGAVRIPRDALPSLDVGPCTIDWVVHVEAAIPLWPDLAVDVPLVVRGAIADDEAPATPPPASTAPHALLLDGERTRAAPGETIAGVVTWRRDEPPRRATLRLVWRTVGPRASHREVVGEVDVAELPRLVAPTADGDPYRGAAPLEDVAAPLAAIERRRFRFVAPDHPYSSRGALFSVTWQLELVVDDDHLGVDLTIAPR